MERKHIWLDCDPGIDDALAIFLLAADPQADLMGISACAGNMDIDTVSENARKLAGLAGIEHVPVYRGCTGPITGKAIEASAVHGSNGIGGITLPETDKKLETANAVAAMAEAFLSLPDPEKGILLVTGPESNAALLLRTFPEVKEKIDRVVVMGGCLGRGNTGRFAEFNVIADPVAVTMVLSSETDVYMAALDLTEKYGILKSRVASLSNDKRFIHRMTGQMLETYINRPNAKERDSIAIHDALAAAFALHPELFKYEMKKLQVEIPDNEYKGRTSESPDGFEVQFLSAMDQQAFDRLLSASLDILEERYETREQRLTA